jgi:hypothetical protein
MDILVLKNRTKLPFKPLYFSISLTINFRPAFFKLALGLRIPLFLIQRDFMVKIKQILLKFGLKMGFLTSLK